MNTAWNWLKGKKTYIIAIAGMIYAGGIQQGWWPHNIWVDGILGGGATASLRHGISTSAAPAANQNQTSP